MWLKDKRKGKACENRTKEDPRTGVRTQVKQTALLAPNLHRAGSRGGEKNIKKGAKIKPLSSLFASYGSASS